MGVNMNAFRIFTIKNSKSVSQPWIRGSFFLFQANMSQLNLLLLFRNPSKIFTCKPAGKRPLGRPRRRWEDNIRMDI